MNETRMNTEAPSTVPPQSSAMGRDHDIARIWFMVAAACLAILPVVLGQRMPITEDLDNGGAFNILLLTPIGVAGFVGLGLSAVPTRRRDLRAGIVTVAVLISWVLVTVAIFQLFGMTTAWDD